MMIGNSKCGENVLNALIKARGRRFVDLAGR